MKKWLNAVYVALTFIVALPPIAKLYGAANGYDCTIGGGAAYPIVAVVLTAIVCALSYFYKPKKTKSTVIICITLMLAWCACMLCFMDYVFVGCLGVILSLVLLGRMLPITLALITGVTIGIVLCMFSVFAGAFGSLRADNSAEIYAQYQSPNGDHTAKVIVYDHGMLGGKTEVALKNELDKFNFLMFHFEKMELVLYSGKYSEHMSIEIEWIDDEFVSVKGVIYSTNGKVLKDE